MNYTQEELKLIEEGGGVKEGTAKERDCLFDGLESYFVEKEGKNVEELLISAEGMVAFSGLCTLYFWFLEVKTVKISGSSRGIMANNVFQPVEMHLLMKLL